MLLVSVSTHLVTGQYATWSCEDCFSDHHRAALCMCDAAIQTSCSNTTYVTYHWRMETVGMQPAHGIFHKGPGELFCIPEAGMCIPWVDSC